MFIRSKKPWELKESDVTDESHYRRRRQFLQASAALTGAALLPGWLAPRAAMAANLPPALAGIAKSPLSTSEEPNSWEDITTYNNFYEFGTGKEDPARNAGTLQTEPWSVTVDGEVNRPGKYALEDLLKGIGLEQRIYRLRCVEAWSMVIPWVGVPLAQILKRYEPTSKAKFVEFTTLLDPSQMPGQRRDVLPWPYVEGLRIDEAMHPLTILATGLYGRELPNQDGAPVRLVVPWKYGFKSAKSIVRIRLTETRPQNTWHVIAPNEYGFYANVNPHVDHPRWSQARERRIGQDSLFAPKRRTEMFNGYAEQVAQLYAGMDLRKNF